MMIWIKGKMNQLNIWKHLNAKNTLFMNVHNNYSQANNEYDILYHKTSIFNKKKH